MLKVKMDVDDFYSDCGWDSDEWDDEPESIYASVITKLNEENNGGYLSPVKTIPRLHPPLPTRIERPKKKLFIDLVNLVNRTINVKRTRNRETFKTKSLFTDEHPKKRCEIRPEISSPIHIENKPIVLPIILNKCVRSGEKCKHVKDQCSCPYVILNIPSQA